MPYRPSYRLIVWFAAVVSPILLCADETRDSLLWRNTEHEFERLNALLLKSDDVNQRTSGPGSLPAFEVFPGDRRRYSPVSYNRVDGLFLGLGSRKRIAVTPLPENILLHGGFGYAFGAHYWQAFGGADLLLPAESFTFNVGVEAYHISDSRDAWKVPDNENSLYALLAGDDAADYLRRSGWSLHGELLPWQDLRLILAYGSEQLSGLPRSVRWSLFGGRDAFSANPGLANDSNAHNWTQHRKTFSLAFALTKIDDLIGYRSGLRLQGLAEFSLDRPASNRYLIEAAWYSPVAAFSLNARTRLAAITGSAGFPQLLTLGGRGSLPAFQRNEFSGNRLALLGLELVWRPARPGKHDLLANIGLIVFADAGYLQTAGPEKSLLSELLPADLREWKLSLGAALGGRNAVWRIGAAWRTDRSAFPRLDLRLSPPF